MKKLFPILLSALAALQLLAQEKTWPVHAAQFFDLTDHARAVVRERVTEFEVESASKAVWRERTVVTVLMENPHFEEFKVHFSPKFEEITAIWVKIYDASGQLVRTIKRPEFYDRSLFDGFSLISDSRVVGVNVQQANWPYTVETFCEKNLTGIRGWRPWWPADEYDWAVESASLKVTCPAGMAPGWRAECLDMVLKTEETGSGTDRHVLHFLVKKMPPFEGEPMTTEGFPVVYFAPDSVSIDGFSGNLSTWKGFGRFYFKINKNRGTLTPEIVAEVHRIADGLPTEKAKIAALYQFLQKTTRYVSIQLGLGGWQTMTAESVCKNKYGDCKALTNFMQAMLVEVGIESHWALIEAGEAFFGEISPDFVHAPFNHAILYVPGEDIWLECTSSDAPMGYLGAFTDGRPALLLKKTGGELVRTPAQSSAQNARKGSARLEIAEDGSAILESSTHLLGHSHETFRHLAKVADLKNAQKVWTKTCPLPAFSIQKWEIVAQSDAPVAEFSAKFAINRWALKSGKRMFVQVFRHEPSPAVPGEMPDRKMPVLTHRGKLETDTILVVFPKNRLVETALPIEINQELPGFGKYCMKIEQVGDGEIKVVRHFERQAGELPKGSYEAARLFLKEVNKGDNAKLVFVER